MTRTHRFHHRRGLWLPLALWCVFVAATSLGRAAQAVGDPLVRAQALLAGLSPAAATAVYAQTARDLGAIVDEARKAGAADETLVHLRKLAADMRKRSQERLRSAELEAGDDEGALEGLYRSATWEDLSFAMSAFPYWGAWLDLTLAERPNRAGDRVQLLWRAKRGFRAASMQIYQPSLVYGGWLGLGFVALAEHQQPRARAVFESLQKALSFDPHHPVRKLVEAELARLDGKAPALPEPAPATTASGPAPSAALTGQAFALLEHHRQTQGGAREAAAKLREVIATDGMDQNLLTRIMSFQKEIVSEDLGLYTDLVGAEFAFGNQQWFTAAQKYQAFFVHEPRVTGVSFDRFKYRWAVACFRSDLAEDAARIAERLLRTPRLEPEVKKAAIKLAYVARAKRADAKSTAEARSTLATAARRFVDASPSDPDADGARVVLAQSTGDTSAALRLLGNVKASRGDQAGMQATRFYVIAREFARVANSPQGGVEGLARQGLSTWDELPADQKKLPENYAFYLQLRAVGDREPAAVLKEIERAEAKAGASLASRRAYFWARLRCYDRLGTPRRALDDLDRLGDAPAPSWMVETLYPWVRQLGDLALRADFAQALAPRLKALPDMERRFRLLAIDTLLAVGQGEEAYAAARALLRDYPRAGDGYRALAKAAAATRRPIEADEAWRVITDKVPPTDEIWWEGMLSRVEIRARSTRPDAACELLDTLERRPNAAPAGQQARLDELKRTVHCIANGA